MNASRLNNTQKHQQILDSLRKRIGCTPLFEFWPGKLPNNNRLFVKAEFMNPTGSHYDRVYLKLFEKDIEQLNKNPPEYLVEVSSGNAGASFAWFCKQLGFSCEVILPPNVPEGFKEHIRHLNPDAKIKVSPYDGARYLEGAVCFLKEQLERARDQGRVVYCPNHSRRDETLEATAEIGNEVVNQLRNSFGVDRLDYFVVACGNGSTIVGPAPVLRSHFCDLKIVAFEPESAPVGYIQKNNPTSPSKPSVHKLFGTGAFGIYFPFIHEKKYQFCNLVHEVRLVTDRDLELAKRLRFKVGYQVGFTSLVALHLALEIMERVCGKSFLIFLYDRGHKYEWFN
jgi:cysteine synthase A